MGKDYTTLSTRRNGVIRRLCRQGVIVNGEENQMEVPYDASPELMARIRRLKRKYRFNVQFYIS